jgi:hypothetical protein
MQHSSSYTSKVTGKQYNILCTFNCKSANIIYILECSACGLQYVGESKQPFHKRLVKKVEWVQKPSKNITLESFIDNVKSDMLRIAKVNTDTFDNISPGERTILQNLRSNEDIII